MTLDEAFDQLGALTEDAPLEAMQCLIDEWDAARLRCWVLLLNYNEGIDRSEATERALFPILHLLAEQQETFAFSAICTLVTDPERADLILAGAINGSLPGMLINCFAGDAAPLERLIKDPYGHPMVRDAALYAMAYLTQVKRVPRSEMQAFLVTLHDAMQDERDGSLAVTWVFVVALLGLRALVSRAMSLFASGQIEPHLIRPQEFQTILRQAAEDPSGIEGFLELGIGPQGSAVETMMDPDDDLGPPLEEPFVNPLRNVGRNDPCPCGSGKKFKKCCLV